MWLVAVRPSSIFLHELYMSSFIFFHQSRLVSTTIGHLQCLLIRWSSRAALYGEIPSPSCSRGDLLGLPSLSCYQHVEKSPHNWFVNFFGLLTIYGFNPFESDLIVMRKTTSLGFIILVIYVNNILFTSNDEVGIDKTCMVIKKHTSTCPNSNQNC